MRDYFSLNLYVAFFILVHEYSANASAYRRLLSCDSYADACAEDDVDGILKNEGYSFSKSPHRILINLLFCREKRTASTPVAIITPFSIATD